MINFIFSAISKVLLFVVVAAISVIALCAAAIAGVFTVGLKG